MVRKGMIAQYKFSETVRLYNLGDIHRGNANCNEKFFRETVQRIADEPNAYWISTGDLLECATRHSISDVHAAMSTQEELDVIESELQPIKHKCLGFVSSNHHHRINKETGVSLDRMVAAHCGLKYLGDTGLINVTVGRGSYYIVLHHGTGGGTEGNAVNRALKAAGNYQGADVYMSGHTHKSTAVPFNQQIIDRKRGIVRNVLSYSIVTGHCLDWKGSYAERMALKPAPLGFAFVDLGLNENGNEAAKRITPGFLSR